MKPEDKRGAVDFRERRSRLCVEANQQSGLVPELRRLTEQDRSHIGPAAVRHFIDPRDRRGDRFVLGHWLSLERGDLLGLCLNDFALGFDRQQESFALPQWAQRVFDGHQLRRQAKEFAGLLLDPVCSGRVFASILIAIPKPFVFGGDPIPRLDLGDQLGIAFRRAESANAIDARLDVAKALAAGLLGLVGNLLGASPIFGKCNDSIEAESGRRRQMRGEIWCGGKRRLRMRPAQLLFDCLMLQRRADRCRELIHGSSLSARAPLRFEFAHHSDPTGVCVSLAGFGRRGQAGGEIAGGDVAAAQDQFRRNDRIAAGRRARERGDDARALCDRALNAPLCPGCFDIGGGKHSRRLDQALGFVARPRAARSGLRRPASAAADRRSAPFSLARARRRASRSATAKAHFWPSGVSANSAGIFPFRRADRTAVSVSPRNRAAPRSPKMCVGRSGTAGVSAEPASARRSRTSASARSSAIAFSRSAARARRAAASAARRSAGVTTLILRRIQSRSARSRSRP
ncbi:MAG: hypothetical protein KDJ20_07865 [Hyphomicrobiales bacterium]|nr:hypothetical protein [Hyphomicrobiales bacterium]MCC2108185.1 hypothetical protein [Hyphomicrobiales bacterium]